MKKSNIIRCTLISFTICFHCHINAQNVGIGTTNPDEKLTVSGTIKTELNSSAGNPHIIIHEQESEFGRLRYTNTSSPEYFNLAGNPQRDSTQARFHINYSEFGNVGSFTGHGRFGVNATNPAAAFHVNAQPNTDLMRMQINNNTKLRIFGNDAMVFGANWATPIPDVIRMETPNLFIGFDGNHVPQNRLEVDGTVQMKGLKMPYGHQDGYVLTSDANGEATWKPRPFDPDMSVTNELQFLSLDGNDLSITNANTIPLKISEISNSNGNEKVITDRSSSYPQVALDVGGIEIISFNMENGQSNLSFQNSSQNISIVTDNLSREITGLNNINLGNAENGIKVIGGSDNVNIGRTWMDTINGDGNIIMGAYAARDALKFISNNVVIGQFAGRELTGDDNVCIGAGSCNGSKRRGVFIGANASSSPTTSSSSVAIGYNAYINSDQHVRIGSNSIQEIGGYKPWSNLSDGRFKQNIKEDIPGLPFVNALRPVIYTINREKVEQFVRGQEGYMRLDEDYKSELRRRSSDFESGFIAQEVESAAMALDYDFDGVLAPQHDRDHYALAYSQFVVPLVKAVQELDEKNTKLNEENDELRAMLNELNQEVRKIKASLPDDSNTFAGTNN